MNESYDVVLQVLVSCYVSPVQINTDKWTEFGCDSLVLTTVPFKAHDCCSV